MENFDGIYSDDACIHENSIDKIIKPVVELFYNDSIKLPPNSWIELIRFTCMIISVENSFVGLNFCIPTLERLYVLRMLDEEIKEILVYTQIGKILHTLIEEYGYNGIKTKEIQKCQKL